MKDREYLPIRVIGKIGAVAATLEELKERYPNGKVVSIQQKYKLGPSSFQVTYDPGTVIDTPTDSERTLFGTVIGKRTVKKKGRRDKEIEITAGVNIPQLGPGCDDPASGYARHPKKSERGYRDFLNSLPPIPMDIKPKAKKKKKSTTETTEPRPAGEAEG